MMWQRVCATLPLLAGIGECMVESDYRSRPLPVGASGAMPPGTTASYAGPRAARRLSAPAA
jgi:hypothetical protein